MGRLRIKKRRSLKFKRSDKTYVVAGLLICTGLLTAYHAFRAVHSPPDIKVVLEAQASPLYMQMIQFMASPLYRISLFLMVLGLLVTLIGYLNRRDEIDGKIETPPEFEG